MPRLLLTTIFTTLAMAFANAANAADLPALAESRPSNDARDIDEQQAFLTDRKSVV